MGEDLKKKKGLRDRRQRIWQFDYIKAICILLVITTHVSYTAEDRQFFLFPYLVDMAVPIFMMISGFVNAQSYDQKGILSIGGYIKNIFNKLISIYIPFTVIFILEVLLLRFVHQYSFSYRDVIVMYIHGGWGPGGYYIPVLAVMIICFPLLYMLMHKSKIVGSFVIISAQLGYQICVQALPISEKYYRILFFRYLFFVWFGMILYFYFSQRNSYKDVSDWWKMKPQNKIIMYGMGLGGFIVIWLLVYSGHQSWLFPYWTGTSMFTAFWAVFLVYLALRFMRKLPSRLDYFISYIGQSTYNIYLVQTIYYGVGLGDNISNLYIQNVLNIIVCCAIGVLFYKLESVARRKIKSLRDK